MTLLLEYIDKIEFLAQFLWNCIFAYFLFCNTRRNVRKIESYEILCEFSLETDITTTYLTTRITRSWFWTMCQAYFNQIFKILRNFNSKILFWTFWYLLRHCLRGIILMQFCIVYIYIYNTKTKGIWSCNMEIIEACSKRKASSCTKTITCPCKTKVIVFYQYFHRYLTNFQSIIFNALDIVLKNLLYNWYFICNVELFVIIIW